MLRVKVREKLSITPIVDFSTGKTLRDTSVTLGAIENNIGGAGTRLGGYAEYAERGPQFAIWISEHSYHPTRWMKEIEISYSGSDFRFDNSNSSWQRTRLGGLFELKTPYRYSSALRYEFVGIAYREHLTYAEGTALPKEGTFVGTMSELIWDRYSFNDLAPHGFKVTLELRPGALLGAAQPRFEARVESIFSAQLGSRTVLAGRATAEAVNSGNVNHSVLIGGQRGVRGLQDAFYRDQAQAFANLELRHAIPLAKRLYLQGVLFADGATFLPMNADGVPTKWLGAFAGGAGLRLIPTALVKTLLRVDGSRLVTPTGEWFVQFGIDQYF